MAVKKTTAKPSATFASILGKMAEGDFKSAKVAATKRIKEQGTFQDVPPDNYLTRLVKVGAKTTQSGNPAVFFQLKIIDGQFEGNSVFKNQNINNETGVSILLQDLARFGYDVSEISKAEEIAQILEDINKSTPKPLVNIKTVASDDPQYPNKVYISKVIADDSGGTEQEGTTETEAGDAANESTSEPSDSSSDETVEVGDTITFTNAKGGPYTGVVIEVSGDDIKAKIGAAK